MATNVMCVCHRVDAESSGYPEGGSGLGVCYGHFGEMSEDISWVRHTCAQQLLGVWWHLETGFNLQHDYEQRGIYWAIAHMEEFRGIVETLRLPTLASDAVEVWRKGKKGTRGMQRTLHTYMVHAVNHT